MINYLLISIIQTIRPLLGPASCKFYPSCTEFAIIELKERPLFRALWIIACRILSCNPFSQ